MRPVCDVQTLELDTHMGALRRIQMRERLVHQEDIRIAHQRPRQRDALLLPAAQLGRFAVQNVGDVQHLRHLTDALADFGRRHDLARARQKAMLSRNGQRRVQRIGFKGQRRHCACSVPASLTTRLPM